jgi:perosamine synthetase
MLLTGDAALARRLRRLREHGMAVSAHERHAAGRVVVEAYEEVGFNFRMTDVQAAIGLVQLGRLDAMIAERRRLARRYRDLLAGVPGLGLPDDPPHGTTNFQSYVVRLHDEVAVDRDDVMRAMLAAGVSTRRGIMAAHLEPACADLAAPPLPVTERLTRRSLVLPLFHAMTAAEQERVAAALASAVAAPALEAAAC